MCVQRQFPADDAEDLVELAEDNPGKYTYATDGVGGIVQVSAERIFRRLKLDLRPMHFDGPDEALSGFIGRKVDIYIGPIGDIIGQTKEGYARCLLATSVEPPKSFRDIDALDEVDAEDQATEVWRGLIAPKGTPPERIKVLAEAFHKAASSNEFDVYVRQRYDFVKIRTPEAFADLIKSESQGIAEVVKKLDLNK